ncbi:NADP-dependent malic enzyme [Picochlorum sp. SENEW3]|nr:NADP-dependent malic enzyme [Picochlorum sp. SENEW3]
MSMLLRHTLRQRLILQRIIETAAVCSTSSSGHTANKWYHHGVFLRNPHNDGHDSDGDSTHSRPTTPWVRSVISGVDLMRNAKYNKGLAFTNGERDRLYLRGLLPPAVISQDVQAERVLINIRHMKTSVRKVTYLMSLQERNERLFYHVLQNNIEELLPLLQFPAMGEYCQKYSLMFRSLPRGLFLSLEDKGHVFSILKNWPERRVKAICLTDGESVGTFGDLGVQAIGSPISRLAQYVALGGVDPSTCLPVTIDNGTDTERLLSDPIYVGMKHHRVRGDDYYELIDELLSAVQRRFGAAVMVDFQDMAFETQSKLVSEYRGSFPVFSDAQFGLPILALAAVLATQRITGTNLADQRFILVGESPVLTAIAELLEEAIQRSTRVGTVLEVRKAIHLVDSKGLLVRTRADADVLEDHKLPYIEDGPECPSLLSAVKHIKPTVIIGLSKDKPPFAFTKEVLEAACEGVERPVILPMSLHSPGGNPGSAEVSAKDAYEWTKGKCFFADRHTHGIIQVGSVQKEATKLCTSHIFPGIALGTTMSRSKRLRDEMFVTVAKTVANLVPDDAIEAGCLMPPIGASRDVAAHVGAGLAGKAYQIGEATELPKPHNLLDHAYESMYQPQYKRYR